jgi:hypothetical protein
MSAETPRNASLTMGSLGRPGSSSNKALFSALCIPTSNHNDAILLQCDELNVKLCYFQVIRESLDLVTAFLRIFGLFVHL